jgi:hypothetical protein
LLGSFLFAFSLLSLVLLFVLGLFVVLGGLEFHIDVDHFIGEDEVLVVAAHPGRFGPIFNFGDAEAGEDEVGVYFWGVLYLYFAAVRHQIAEFGALDRE